MSQNPLNDFTEKLRGMTPPEADSHAREEALRLSLAAYESAMKHPSKKISQGRKGFSVWRRLLEVRGNDAVRAYRKTEAMKRKSSLLQNVAPAGMIVAGACLICLPFLLQNMASTISNGNNTLNQRPNIVANDSSGIGQIFANMTTNLNSAPRLFSLPQKPAAAPRSDADKRSEMGVQEAARMAAPATMNAMNMADSIMIAPPILESNRNQFANAAENPFQPVSVAPVSTFSLDVDTASFAFSRKMLEAGQLPPAEAVRTEEFINAVDYAYAPAESLEKPIKATLFTRQTPWNQDTQLVQIGVESFAPSATERPAANLVFLVDVSGSMASPDKLPLVQASLKMLVNGLRDDDRVAIVTYAGQSGVALPPTRIENKREILARIDSLGAGGSTAGAAGIETAYDLAQQHFVDDGINRVILATDGDFNVGMSDPEALKNLVAKKRDSGIFLSVLGFGNGNYQDVTMQALAQNGNGVAAYIDSLAEAEKRLVNDLTASMFTVARDAKIQIEFNPAEVSAYRLIGYETRALQQQDFSNDRIDAGDVGAGQSVTAIYEIMPVGSKGAADMALRYGKNDSEIAGKAPFKGEIAWLKLRYKPLKARESVLTEQPVHAASDAVTATHTGFAVAMAAFAQKLRGNAALADYDWDDLISFAEENRGADRNGERGKAIGMMRMAQALSEKQGSPGLPYDDTQPPIQIMPR